MDPVSANPLQELKRAQEELHFERGVVWALRQIDGGMKPEEIFRQSVSRVEMLTAMAEKLKRMVR